MKQARALFWKAAALGAVGIGMAWAILGIEGPAPTPGADAAAAQPTAQTAYAAATTRQGEAAAASPWVASPFAKGPSGEQPLGPRAGPAEHMISIPALQARWAGDPKRDEKIENVIAVTKLQDRISGIGETLSALPPGARQSEVDLLVNQMQDFAARGVLPQDEVDDVTEQLLAFVDPRKHNASQTQNHSRRNGPRGFR